MVHFLQDECVGPLCNGQAKGGQGSCFGCSVRCAFAARDVTKSLSPDSPERSPLFCPSQARHEPMVGMPLDLPCQYNDKGYMLGPLRGTLPRPIYSLPCPISQLQCPYLSTLCLALPPSPCNCSASYLSILVHVSAAVSLWPAQRCIFLSSLPSRPASP